MGARVGVRSAIAARVGVQASDWEQAIRAAAGLLVAAEVASPAYVDRCVEIVREQGPYIVVVPGVALAHARPEDGALAVGLAVACLSTPVRFGHPTNDPVDIVLAFASPDRDAHVGLLAALARGLGTGLADELRSAASDEQAAVLLEEVIE